MLQRSYWLDWPNSQGKIVLMCACKTSFFSRTFLDWVKRRERENWVVTMGGGSCPQTWICCSRLITAGLLNCARNWEKSSEMFTCEKNQNVFRVKMEEQDQRARSLMMVMGTLTGNFLRENETNSKLLLPWNPFSVLEVAFFKSASRLSKLMYINCRPFIFSAVDRFSQIYHTMQACATKLQQMFCSFSLCVQMSGSRYQTEVLLPGANAVTLQVYLMLLLCSSKLSY